jgi:hypothetical protein
MLLLLNQTTASGILTPTCVMNLYANPDPLRFLTIPRHGTGRTPGSNPVVTHFFFFFCFFFFFFLGGG